MLEKTWRRGRWSLQVDLDWRCWYFGAGISLKPMPGALIDLGPLHILLDEVHGG